MYNLLFHSNCLPHYEARFHAVPPGHHLPALAATDPHHGPPPGPGRADAVVFQRESQVPRQRGKE